VLRRRLADHQEAHVQGATSETNQRTNPGRPPPTGP
jgi:hypothetical protein